MKIQSTTDPASQPKVSSFAKGLPLAVSGRIFWQEEEDGTVSGIAAVNGAEIRYFAPKESALWERILANTEAEEFRVFAQTPPDSPSLCVLAEADGLHLLEQGKGIASALNGLKVQISYGLDVDFTQPHDMACVLLSGNPFTYAQLELAERAAGEHDYLLVLVPEGETEPFSFQERYAMTYVAMKPYRNAIVLPATPYLTVREPADEGRQVLCRLRAQLLKNYFLPQLGICALYGGDESTDHTTVDTLCLREALQDNFVSVSTEEKTATPQAARERLRAGDLAQAASYLPPSCRGLVLAMSAKFHR